MVEIFREDPAYAVALLNDVLEDEETLPGELLIVLRQMAKAFGGVTKVAERAKLNPTQMYRTLSADGNPSLSSFTAILRAMGMRLAVKAIGRPETALAVAPKKAQRARKKPARARTGVASKAAAAR
jgi:probable addiction module antidote protein